MSILKIFENQSERRMSHLKNIFTIALADGEIDSEELNTIFNISHKIGITKEEFDFVFNNNESIKNKVPVSFKDKHLQLCHLIAIMFVDGQIERNELNYVYQLSEKLGYDKLAVHAYIDMLFMLINAHNDVPSAINEFLEITTKVD
jgi:uncharacterized tellurite resistance protein B-like protein